jgi:hypothetical protein
MADDILQLLMPEASAEERARLRGVITALRLLCDDARTPAERRAAPSWRRAREELGRRQRVARWRAIESLLYAYARALLPASSFLDLGARTMEPGQAWATLLADPASALAPPDPLEPRAATLARLLGAAEVVASRGTLLLWEARAQHLTLAPAESERLWERSLRTAREAGAPALLQARLAAGWVAARLDARAPGRALELLRAWPALFGLDLGLRRGLGWSALLAGELEAARTLLSGLPAPDGLPTALVELRADWPELAGLVPGELRTEACAGPRFALDRRRAGALLVALVTRGGEGTPRLAALEAARGLRAVAERSARTCSLAGELLAPRRVRRRPGGAPLAEAWCGAATQALLLQRVEVSGVRGEAWLRVECAHQLLPTANELGALARALESEREAHLRRSGPRTSAPDARPFDPTDPRRAFAQRLLGALPSRTRARWLERAEGSLVVRAERGVSWPNSMARIEAMGRAVSTREVVRFRCSEGSNHHDGCVLPLAERGAVLALLVLELDGQELSEAAVEAARKALRAFVPHWWSASFRAGYRRHTGDDLAWDIERRFLAGLEPAIAAGLPARAPLCIAGAPGSGRRTLARWLAFREGADESAFALDPPELERLTLTEQARRARALDGRWLVLARESPRALRQRGCLAPELEGRLEPLPLVVPPLAERRDEIPGLVTVLARNAARREGLAPPVLLEDAVADLWRQDWLGGIEELAALLRQVVVTHAGAEVGSPAVAAALRARGLEPRRRLPSWRPRRNDIELALESTRHRSGGLNRARAARYLGWDPATLARHLREESPPMSRRKKRGASRVPDWRLSSVSPWSVPQGTDP